MTSFDLDLNDTRTSLGVAAGGIKKEPLKVSSKKEKSKEKQTFECSSANGTLCSSRT